MPYREKTAWLALIALTLAFTPYFVLIASGMVPLVSLPDLRQLALYAGVAGVQVLILGLGHLYLRRSSRADARVPPDERDRAIMAHSTRIGYYVLMAGMILVGVIMPFEASGWRIVHAAIFMIVLAQIVQNAIVVIAYRRQAAWLA